MVCYELEHGPHSLQLPLYFLLATVAQKFSSNLQTQPKIIAAVKVHVRFMIPLMRCPTAKMRKKTKGRTFNGSEG